MHAQREDGKKSRTVKDTEFILANIARHISLNESEKELFLSKLETVDLKNKDYLLRAGEINRYLSFVVQGCLRTFSTDEQGREHIVLFAPENWWCGDMFSYLSGAAARYSTQALGASTVARISRDKLEKLYLEVPKFERFFRELFQNAFVLYENRINSNLSATALARYKEFDATYPGLAGRIAAKYIAAYIGVTPEFFSQMQR